MPGRPKDGSPFPLYHRHARPPHPGQYCIALLNRNIRVQTGKEGHLVLAMLSKDPGRTFSPPFLQEGRKPRRVQLTPKSDTTFPWQPGSRAQVVIICIHGVCYRHQHTGKSLQQPAAVVGNRQVHPQKIGTCPDARISGRTGCKDGNISTRNSGGIC